MLMEAQCVKLMNHNWRVLQEKGKQEAAKSLLPFSGPLSLFRACFENHCTCHTAFSSGSFLSPSSFSGQKSGLSCQTAWVSYLAVALTSWMPLDKVFNQFVLQLPHLFSEVVDSGEGVSESRTLEKESVNPYMPSGQKRAWQGGRAPRMPCVYDPGFFTVSAAETPFYLVPPQWTNRQGVVSGIGPRNSFFFF